MTPSAEKDYAQRLPANLAAVRDLADWLAVDGHLRTLERSWGDLQITLGWEDGHLRRLTVRATHVYVLPRDRVRHPAAAGVDPALWQAAGWGQRSTA